MTSRPRRQYQFKTVGLSESTHYVPVPVREPELVELFEGSPAGTRMAWLQRNGLEILSGVLEDAYESGDEYEVQVAANIAAMTTFGTTYHAAVQGTHAERAFMVAKLPDIAEIRQGQDPTESLVWRIQRGLVNAVHLSSALESIVQERRDARPGHRKLGQFLGHIGMEMASLHDGVVDLDTDVPHQQQKAYEAAANAENRFVHFSLQNGTMPTAAQLADMNSPLMRAVHDDRTLATSLTQQSLFDRSRQKILDAS